MDDSLVEKINLRRPKAMQDMKALGMRDITRVTRYITDQIDISYSTFALFYGSPQSDKQRFAMRTYLCRLGLNGDEFANCREHFFDALKGSAAWRFRAA